jgi:hypothetical protein
VNFLTTGIFLQNFLIPCNQQASTTFSETQESLWLAKMITFVTIALDITESLL